MGDLYACFTIGNDVNGGPPHGGGFWKLTLASYTPSVPEPSTLWTSMGAFGIFGIGWELKRRNARKAEVPLNATRGPAQL